MSSVDTLINDAEKNAVAIFEKLKLDIKTALEPVPVPIPPTPPSNVYDDYPSVYDINTGDTLTPNKKERVIYTGYNPDNHSITGHAGVRVPNKLPPDNSPRVFFAYPYISGYTGTGTNASLTLTEVEFANFDMTFYMRTLKSLKTKPNVWEVAWLLFRFNTAGFPTTDPRAHFHHYFLDIKNTGVIEFGRKDNIGQREEQTFLSTNQTTTFAYGTWLKIRIKAIGNHFTIWINDTQKIDLTDDGSIGSRKEQKIVNGQKTSVPIAVEPPRSYMAKGRLGPYAEDSESEWGPFTIIPA